MSRWKNEPSHSLIGHSVWHVGLLEKKTTTKDITRDSNALQLFAAYYTSGRWFLTRLGARTRMWTRVVYKAYLAERVRSDVRALAPKWHHLKSRTKSSASRCEGGSQSASHAQKARGLMELHSFHRREERRLHGMSQSTASLNRTLVIHPVRGSSGQPRSYFEDFHIYQHKRHKHFRSRCHWTWRRVGPTSHRIHPRTWKTNHYRHQRTNRDTIPISIAVYGDPTE